MNHLVFVPDATRAGFFLWSPKPRGSVPSKAKASRSGGASPSDAGYPPGRASPSRAASFSDRTSFFSDGAAGSPLAAALAARGTRAARPIVDETLSVTEIEGTAIPLLDALPVLAATTTAEIESVPASLAGWCLAAKLALELVGRERVVPSIVRAPDGRTEARWGVALSLAADVERVTALARALPPAAHALPVEAQTDSAGKARRRKASASVVVWAPDALLRAFLDAAADAIVRESLAPAAVNKGAGALATTLAKAAAPAPARRPAKASAAPAAASRSSAKRGAPAPAEWERRLEAALTSSEPSFETAGYGERSLAAELEAWARPGLGVDTGAARGCLKLDLPVGGTQSPVTRRAPSGTFRLHYFLQAADDPSLLVPADTVWTATRKSLRHLGHTFAAPQEQLLRSLGAAARVFPPIERSLSEPKPVAAALDESEAWSFLTEAAPMLAEAGIGVILPAELTSSGRQRLRLRMRLGTTSTRVAGTVDGTGLGLGEAVEFQWEIALGDDALSAADFAALAKLKSPLVQWRGQWVAVDPAELAELNRLLAGGGGRLSAAEALSAALAGSIRSAELAAPIEVLAGGRLAGALDRLRAGDAGVAAVAPRGLHGKLRPYQERGVAWLASMASLGLGGCLADDMGLGKSIETLAFLLHRRHAQASDRRPALIVCPTSVVGNWEREIARFAPSLPVVRHYGNERARSPEALADGPAGAVVLTSYGVLRRDVEILRAVDWAVAVLDEAQNIKNAASSTARAARSLPASDRFALTGTPVENRLAELWSILEFASPGLLGPLESFRRDYAVPIERYRDGPAAERLRRIVRPFVLRRLKSDPAVIHDLPPKNEMKVICSLTREQATLYQAAVDEALRKIEHSEGIQRRGMVLALLTALKQICNHPAHFLGEPGPLPGRSGKLARVVEMLEEVLAEGDRALVFTQFREMGDRLVAHLTRALSTEVLFLHGGVPRAARDTMVRRFQEDDHGPRLFILSLKAGGTGLNLTAASHVFHFDRWWNPAVEDQATDRAHRIGQRRAVQVHKLISAGTVEEKIDRMLEDKRELAERIVGAGEQWITEMDDRELRELFALSADAVVTAEDVDLDDEGPAHPLRARPRRSRREREEVPA